jgi:hypothetical protein
MGGVVTAAYEKVPGVLEIWLEQPLDRQWVALFRLVRRGGGSDRFRVGELRIFPAEAGRRVAGEWSGSWRGIEAEAPRRGLTTKVVKLAQPHLWLQSMRTFAPRFRELFPDNVELPVAPSRSPTERRGRPKLPDKFLATVAREYAVASAAGKPPVEAVAQRHGEDVAKVRGWIHKARLRGFLTVSAQGKTGGEVTPKATFVLETEKRARRHATGRK